MHKAYSGVHRVPLLRSQIATLQKDPPVAKIFALLENDRPERQKR
jgi:hypothetical protein